LSKSAKGAAAKVKGAAADAADKTSAAADVATKKAKETAAAASAKAGELYESAHDSIQQRTGSDKPLRQQASEKAADVSARAKDAASSASEYGTAARAKAGELYTQAHDTIQAKTGSDEPLRQQAAAKASEWASTLEAAAGTAKEKIVEYAGIAQAKAAEAYKSASSSLGMSGGADQTVTTSTYESRETIVDKDDTTGTAKVAKHETWTEQTNNGPKKENSKDSQYTTTVGAEGKL